MATRAEEREKWLKLPEEFRKEVVAYLDKELNEEFFVGMKKAVKDDPEAWWAIRGWHFGQGMAIRNLLREGGFTDEKLPVPDYATEADHGNWDDYYIQALEEAAGLYNDN